MEIPTANTHSLRCRLAVSREELNDGKEWSIFVLNDMLSPMEVTLVRVSYEWGDQGHSAVPAILLQVPARGNVLLWREGSDGSELNVEVSLQIESLGQRANVSFELGKLYRKRNPVLIEELSRAGWLLLPVQTGGA